MTLPAAASTLYRLLTESYARWLNQPLVDPALTDEQGARWLYQEAPFGLLAHDTRADPVFVYGNLAAQRCFEYSWDELLQLPSRLSARPQQVEDRRLFLERVSQQGFSTGYRGLRVSKSERSFWINDGTVWQLVDEAGVLRGQAALFTL
ncbi:MEKHLA domain-containing protein [Dyella sp.]|uniref:MEKHLA domain-containing protein n=1 Tax=Dyella sp. TaxID=1869338 RepID=UPI002B45A456|nr:MEKHLA domain-containing protein [Dyella sp.]HKT29378.1 MEKHLA domain-containing protein [Dyella sp.]